MGTFGMSLKAQNAHVEFNLSIEREQVVDCLTPPYWSVSQVEGYSVSVSIPVSLGRVHISEAPTRGWTLQRMW